MKCGGSCIVCRNLKYGRDGSRVNGNAISDPLKTIGRSVMADFEERDLAESEAPEKKSSDLKSLAQGIGFLFVIGMVIWLGWYGWRYFKHIGWIPQTRIIDVHMSGDWLTGEYRGCQTDGRADVLFCPKSGESQTVLAASGQAPRSFSVGFYGNITGKHDDTLKWICKRETESISCHAVR
jgi:hypothetical protein